MYRCVINLDQNPERWAAIEPQFRALGIEVERIPAVLGSALPEAERNAWVRPPEFGYLYPLTPGENGCFLSHRKVWETFLATEHAWCWVFEDDIHLSPDIKPYLQSDDWIPEGVDVIKFYAPGTDILIDRNIRKTGFGTDLVRQIRPISFGTVSYLISRRAAEEALRMSMSFSCPVDYFMFSPWFPLVRKFPAWRLGIRLLQLTGAPSVIGKRKRKGGLQEDKSGRWNPLRWAKQIAISTEKLGKIHYTVKDGNFE